MIKPTIFLLLAFSGSLSAAAQATPAVTVSPGYDGFQFPTVAGSLHFAVSASEVAYVGNNGSGGASASTNISGDVAYLSQSQKHPFSLIYSGGFLTGNSSLSNSVYQNLAASQIIPVHRWTFIVGDSASYLPQTATVGLSGIPGVGDVGFDPVSVVSGSGLGILTQQSSRIANTVTGSASRPITARLSFQSSATYYNLNYVGGSNTASGINDSQSNFNSGLFYSLDRHSSVGVNYGYATSSFGPLASSFHSQSVNVSYLRQVNRRLSLTASAGPQWTSGGALTQGSTNVSAAVSANYSARLGGLSASYSRGTSSGSGVSFGSLSQSLQASAQHRFGRALNGSLNVAYSRSTNIPNAVTLPFTTNASVAGVQLNRAVWQNFSVFVTYTVERQSVQGAGLSSNTFNGLFQVIGAGLTYSPKSLRLGRR